ncbi:MAG: hypothetical protein AB7G20_02150 [Sulfurimonas sp.]|uniref:hypothetical protein n=1 Tax=Sulfurimonas sp. TaxID=2022749 RepID=UPI003D1130DF
MVALFENELKQHLQTLVDTPESVRPYLGEFDDPESLQSCIKSAPVIFIDFDGDEVIDTYRKMCRWNLYIVGSTASKQEKYREVSRHELIEFMEKVDKSLIDRSFSNSGSIKLIASKKIFDGITNHGYLSVYVRNFSAVLFEDEVEILEEE